MPSGKVRREIVRITQTCEGAEGFGVESTNIRQKNKSFEK